MGSDTLAFIILFSFVLRRLRINTRTLTVSEDNASLKEAILLSVCKEVSTSHCTY